MLQVQNLDYRSVTIIKTDPTELLEMPDEVMLFLIPNLLREHIFNKYNFK